MGELLLGGCSFTWITTISLLLKTPLSSARQLLRTGKRERGAMYCECAALGLLSQELTTHPWGVKRDRVATLLFGRPLEFEIDGMQFE